MTYGWIRWWGVIARCCEYACCEQVSLPQSACAVHPGQYCREIPGGETVTGTHRLHDVDVECGDRCSGAARFDLGGVCGVGFDDEPGTVAELFAQRARFRCAECCFGFVRAE